MLIYMLLSFSAVLGREAMVSDIFEFIQNDDVENLKDLLSKHPLIIDRPGPGGQTPLMAAVLMGSTKCTDFLLKQGADHTIGEKDGYTPVHGAAFQGR